MDFDDDDLLVETIRLGTWQRVAVLHVGSGREVVVRGHAATPLAVLVATARRRLALPPSRASARPTPDQG